MLGFRRPKSKIQELVWCGEMGVQGFCEYLEVLVDEGSIVGGLIEGKASTLVEAIKGESNGKNIKMDCMLKELWWTQFIKWCVGIYLEMPAGVLTYSAYPFMLHEVYTLPWDIHIVGHWLSIQSTNCNGVRGQQSESCQPCTKLLTHQIVEGILNRIKHGIHANTAFAFLLIAGLLEILQKRNVALDGMQFEHLSILWTLATRAWTLGQYKQLVMAMSEKSVNWLDTLLQAGLNCGVGVRRMMELLDHAQKGLYKPKNFSEEEMSCGLLFLWLGGAHVASLTHQTLRLPGVSTLCHSSAVTPLSPSAGFPSKMEICYNL